MIMTKDTHGSTLNTDRIMVLLAVIAIIAFCSIPRFVSPHHAEQAAQATPRAALDHGNILQHLSFDGSLLSVMQLLFIVLMSAYLLVTLKKVHRAKRTLIGSPEITAAQGIAAGQTPAYVALDEHSLSLDLSPELITLHVNLHNSGASAAHRINLAHHCKLMYVYTEADLDQPLSPNHEQRLQPAVRINVEHGLAAQQSSRLSMAFPIAEHYGLIKASACYLLIICEIHYLDAAGRAHTTHHCLKIDQQNFSAKRPITLHTSPTQAAA